MAVPVRCDLLVGQLSQGPSLTTVSLYGKCPRCGEGKMFVGILAIREQCSHCQLNLAEHEKGDGPAFFAITIIGALVCLCAAIVELSYQPPYWVHATLWLPFIIIGSLVILRIAKAMIIALQFKHKVNAFHDDD